MITCCWEGKEWIREELEGERKQSGFDQNILHACAYV